MSAQPSETISDDERSVDAPRSVLQDISSRQRARRRRGHVPVWLTWSGRCFCRMRAVLTQTIPAWIRQHRQTLLTALTSSVVHLFVALFLALWVLPSETTDQIISLLAVAAPKEEVIPVELTEIVQPKSLNDLKVDNTVQQVLEVIDETTTDLASLDTNQDLELDLQPTEQDLASFAKLGDFGGRSSFGKLAAIRKYGGTAESERAVNAGLEWLKKLQQPDGSWSFGAVGEGASAGRLRTTDMGATSMALLCFLGAGHTHRTDGKYQDTVRNGLKYMTENARQNRTSADLRGNFQGNSGLYVQGLATICLCEANAMEPGDSRLSRIAQKAIRFIENSQHKKGGGWRYEPGEPGDTSVVGWQVMAMQSARTGDLSVSQRATRKVEYFLDSVQSDDGALYGYMSRRNPSPSMTSVGLLCRMYLGWRRDHASLRKGVARLTAIGPDSEDMYYNYYATQVIHHWGGREWTKWNNVMRNQLVSSQITPGPAAGSWAPQGPHSYEGGQIYETALCLLTLEIYYRHLPIYRDLED